MSGSARARVGHRNLQHLECRNVSAVCKAVLLKGFLGNSVEPVTKGIAGTLPSVAGMTGTCSASSGTEQCPPPSFYHPQGSAGRSTKVGEFLKTARVDN